eukprot:TRINITY_DN38238_c0_g3_i1.p1 TRINITY_DN38238_c0_g3~~TRINITY_DN38238_c0_g3_i1.p1  ORF type:complete len:1004 (-),score=218.94 TRINITY_DN38238_c0_g3_i1:111-3122(-)
MAATDLVSPDAPPSPRRNREDIAPMEPAKEPEPESFSGREEADEDHDEGSPSIASARTTKAGACCTGKADAKAEEYEPMKKAVSNDGSWDKCEDESSDCIESNSNTKNNNWKIGCEHEQRHQGGDEPSKQRLAHCATHTASSPGSGLRSPAAGAGATPDEGEEEEDHSVDAPPLRLQDGGSPSCDEESGDAAVEAEQDARAQALEDEGCGEDEECVPRQRPALPSTDDLAEEVAEELLSPSSRGWLDRVPWPRCCKRRWAGLRARIAGLQEDEDGEDMLGDELLGTSTGSETGKEAGSQGSEWMVVHEGGLLTEEGETMTASSLASKLEKLLLLMMAPAVHGIPQLGVPGAMERADELLAQHGRDVDAAAREVVAGSERTVSQLVLHFCLERIPVLGCPTVLLRTTWGNLRSIFIIAALYGHDLDNPRTLNEAMFCLVPPGADDANAGPGPWDKYTTQDQVLAETTKKVARMLIKSALRNATGLQAAADCFELVSLLYNTCGQGAAQEDEDGFVHVLPTPASAARDLFRRKSLASSALLWGSLPLLVVGVFAPYIFQVAQGVPAFLAAVHAVLQWMPRPSCLRTLPALCIALVGLAFAARTLYRMLLPATARRRGFRFWLRRGIRQPKSWLQRAGGERLQRFVHDIREAWPWLVCLLVFGTHALLPAVSAYSAASVILNSVFSDDPSDGWDTLHRLLGVGLGLYSFCQVVLQHMQDEWPYACYGSWPHVARGMLRGLGTISAVARALSVLMAWTYASLVLDLALTRCGRWLGQYSVTSTSSVLGVMGPMAWAMGAVPGTSPLSVKAITFSLQLISIFSQQRLLELLSRREVLLRLIGAKRLTSQTLLLLLKGVSVALDGPWIGSSPLAEFLLKVAPPPIYCVVVVALRSHSVLVGTALVLTPRLISTQALSGWSAFVLGIAAGTYAAHSVLSVWYANQGDLDSPALRLALLVPGGVSSRAKGLLRDALADARKRAVQMVAMGLVKRLISWLWRPATLNPALAQ